jgi:predicted NBD/HSP70 family sugar kinase
VSGARAEVIEKPNILELAGVGVQPSGVRLTNQRVILTLISNNPGSSAAELSRLSKLAPQTVAAILDDLDKAGLVKAGQVLRGRRGQPATPYFVNPDAAYTIGIEVGWQHVEARLVNIGGAVLGEYRRDYAYPDARTLFTELGQVVRQLQSKLSIAEQERLLCVGVAAPNGIDRNISLLNPDPDVRAQWSRINFRESLEAALRLPVQVFNDGNAACWAELGAHPKPRPATFAYVLISTFVGAGIVTDGTLWEGPTGNSANLGSMLITDRHGDHNFVHLIASIYALQQRLAGAGIVVPQTTPLFWPWEEWEPHVSDWIDDAGYALAKCLMNTVAVIELNYVVIDGVMPASVTDRLIARIREHFARLPTLTFDQPTVAKGHLGGAAPATGAAYLPLYRRYFSRDLNHLSE